LAEPDDAPVKAPQRRAARRLWSLPASRAAHANQEERLVVSRTIVEASWLVPVLILGFALIERRALAAGAAVYVAVVAGCYAAALLALRHLERTAGMSSWPVLARCGLMIAFITLALWLLGAAAAPVLALYHLVVVASAVALGHQATLLNLLLIGSCLLLLTYPESGAPLQRDLALVAQFAAMIAAAYLVSRVAGDVRHALARVRFISETDELTRLYNLRAFMRIAERAHRQAKRYGRPYAIVMIDSDNLKSVNDAHGHECGNDLLKLTTASIRRALRETDVAARYGGDEFILLLPETASTGARELSERVRRAVAGKSLDVRGMRVGTSVSLGVASFPKHGSDLQSIVNKADQAMYLSKKTGRNRVTLFDPG
jgi:diguanylate cyclase (GGDEF)-like protein